MLSDGVIVVRGSVMALKDEIFDSIELGAMLQVASSSEHSSQSDRDECNTVEAKQVAGTSRSWGEGERGDFDRIRY